MMSIRIPLVLLAVYLAGVVPLGTGVWPFGGMGWPYIDSGLDTL